MARRTSRRANPDKADFAKLALGAGALIVLAVSGRKGNAAPAYSVDDTLPGGGLPDTTAPPASRPPGGSGGGSRSAVIGLQQACLDIADSLVARGHTGLIAKIADVRSHGGADGDWGSRSAALLTAIRDIYARDPHAPQFGELPTRTSSDGNFIAAENHIRDLLLVDLDSDPNLMKVSGGTTGTSTATPPGNFSGTKVDAVKELQQACIDIGQVLRDRGNASVAAALYSRADGQWGPNSLRLYNAIGDVYANFGDSTTVTPPSSSFSAQQFHNYAVALRDDLRALEANPNLCKVGAGAPGAETSSPATNSKATLTNTLKSLGDALASLTTEIRNRARVADSGSTGSTGTGIRPVLNSNTPLSSAHLPDYGTSTAQGKLDGYTRVMGFLSTARANCDALLSISNLSTVATRAGVDAMKSRIPQPAFLSASNASAILKAANDPESSNTDYLSASEKIWPLTRKISEVRDAMRGNVNAAEMIMRPYIQR